MEPEEEPFKRTDVVPSQVLVGLAEWSPCTVEAEKFQMTGLQARNQRRKETPQKSSCMPTSMLQLLGLYCTGVHCVYTYEYSSTGNYIPILSTPIYSPYPYVAQYPQTACLLPDIRLVASASRFALAGIRGRECQPLGKRLIVLASLSLKLSQWAVGASMSFRPIVLM